MKLPRMKLAGPVVALALDTMRVSDVERMHQLIPCSQLLICEHGSHLANWDDEDARFTGLLSFLDGLRTK